MSDTSQPPTPPPAAAPPSTTPDRLYQVAAWVAIIAGIVFIAATALFVVCMLWCCH